MIRLRPALLLFAITVVGLGFATPAAARDRDDCRERLFDRYGEAYWGPGRNCDEEGNRNRHGRWRDERDGRDERPCRRRLEDKWGEGYWGPGRNCDEERDGRDNRPCRRRLVDKWGEGYWGPGPNCDEKGYRGRARRN